MIDCVLSTDMSHHFKKLNELKTRMIQSDFTQTKGSDKLSIIQFAFHLADISNPVKQWEICRDWTDLLYVEFFSQGDLERQQGFPMSQLCDRNTTNVAKSQIGFLDFIIQPSYQVLIGLCPNLEPLMTQIAKNKAKWITLFEEYEQRMAAGNNYMIEIIEDRCLPGASRTRKN